MSDQTPGASRDRRPAPRYDLCAFSSKHVEHVVDVRRQQTICGINAADMQVIRQFENAAEIKAERSPHGWPDPWCRRCIGWVGAMVTELGSESRQRLEGFFKLLGSHRRVGRMILISDVPAPGLCRCACSRNHPSMVFVKSQRPVCDNEPDESGVCQPCRSFTTRPSISRR